MFGPCVSGAADDRARASARKNKRRRAAGGLCARGTTERPGRLRPGGRGRPVARKGAARAGGAAPIHCTRAA